MSIYLIDEGFMELVSFVWRLWREEKEFRQMSQHMPKRESCRMQMWAPAGCGVAQRTGLLLRAYLWTRVQRLKALHALEAFKVLPTGCQLLRMQPVQESPAHTLGILQLSRDLSTQKGEGCWQQRS